MKRHGNPEPALMAPVQSFPNTGYGSRANFRGGFYHRGGYRGGEATGPRQSYRDRAWKAPPNRGRFQSWPNKGGSSRPRSSSEENCWRCGGVYHSPNNCNVKDKICDRCGQMGHIKRVCFGNFKRTGGEVLDVPPKKIAVIEDCGKCEEEPKVENSVIKSNLLHSACAVQSFAIEEKMTIHDNLTYQPNIDNKAFDAGGSNKAAINHVKMPTNTQTTVERSLSYTSDGKDLRKHIDCVDRLGLEEKTIDNTQGVSIN
ncbi:uncharacterized protein LOC110679262 [Aedes aegypti]|uniref:Uncharacterized protein n=1 Tax=Aedes aegypti TaxID=7159 RepID=A0A6I8TYD2_AEDAE|nr:uncharacterized protein LOC110679262 [Aedes aegypti]